MTIFECYLDIKKYLNSRYMSSKVLQILNRKINDANQKLNDNFKLYEKHIMNVELKDKNVYLIYDDYSKVNLGKFFESSDEKFVDVKLVNKDYGYDLVLTNEADDTFVINNIEETFKLPKYNNLRVHHVGVTSAKILDGYLKLQLSDSSEINAGIVRGNKGEKGTRGMRGDRGEVGFRGENGDKGSQGDTGLRGPKGDIGPRGETGPQGSRGEQGLKGLKGSQGHDGLKGEMGHRGFDGEVGQKGAKGDPGKDGDNGMKGMKGQIGVPGPDGLKGNRGPAGFQGEKGAPGVEGPQGLSGPRGITGDPGERGSKGSEGKQGDQGPIGQKGERGPEGEKGVQGKVGETGNKGEPGEIGKRGYEGKHGEKGEEGKKGERGEPGPIGINGSQGPQGKAGQRGQKGDVGINGAYIDKSGHLCIVRDNSTRAERIGNVIPNNTTFRNILVSGSTNLNNIIAVELKESIGRLVAINGNINNDYNIDNIVPQCEITLDGNKNLYFGVITHTNPLYVRTEGLVLIWTSNDVGNLLKGDLLCVSTNGFAHKKTNINNVGIAKCLIDCDFNLESSNYKIVEKPVGNTKIRYALLPCLLI
jgi:hypothetical protein